MPHARLIPALVLGVLALAPGALRAETCQVQVREDANLSADSPYFAGARPGTDRPVAGMSVELLGAGGAIQATTGADGTLSATLAAGSYLLTPALAPGQFATSHNVPLSLKGAVARGDLKLVAFGDSIGTSGSPPYPTFLEGLLDPLAPTTLLNVAKGGSEAAEWTPGTPYYEDRLAPVAADADVIVFTLGGNDLAHHLGDAGSDPVAILLALLALPALVLEVEADIAATVDALHTLNPDATLLFMVYPNYASTSEWEELFGILYPVVQKGTAALFAHLRDATAQIPYLVTADMLGAWGWDAPLDGLLKDAVHPNQTGHALIAEEMFVSLGGVRVGPEPLGLSREIWLSPAP